MPIEATGATRREWRCMRRLNLLTALSLVLAACDGGASGGDASGGAGGKVVDGAVGGGAPGSGGTGGGAGNGPGGAGAGGMDVGGAAGDGGAGRGGADGSAGDGGGPDGSAGGDGGVSVDGAADGGAAGVSGAAGLGGDASTQPLDGGGTIQSVPLSTNDLVFDSTRGVLYASMNPTADAGSSVLTIDPASGTVTGALPVGGLPSVLAINDDRSALYVGISTSQIDGADSVLRIALASMTAGPPVSLGTNTLSKLSAGQIAAVPGSATQYMVSRRQPGFQPDFAGLALYDGTTRLAELDSFYGSADSIAFVDHSTLIGCSNLLSPSELNRFSVTSTAITRGTYVRDVIAGAARTRIAFGSGWIFASDGHAVNAATLAPLGRYGDPLILSYSTVAPVPDPDGANVWFLGYANASTSLLAFDRTTFQLRRTISLGPIYLPNPGSLVRWSPTGFALRTDETLVLIKLPN
jgi:hypothetical protein